MLGDVYKRQPLSLACKNNTRNTSSKQVMYSLCKACKRVVFPLPGEPVSTYRLCCFIWDTNLQFLRFTSCLKSISLSGCPRPPKPLYFTIDFESNWKSQQIGLQTISLSLSCLPMSRKKLLFGLFLQITLFKLRSEILPKIHMSAFRSKGFLAHPIKSYPNTKRLHRLRASFSCSNFRIFTISFKHQHWKTHFSTIPNAVRYEFQNMAVTFKRWWIKRWKNPKKNSETKWRMPLSV